MVDCLNNLNVCKASCCKVISFTVKALTEDRIRYYEYHGCNIRKNKNRTFTIEVPAKCEKLTHDYKCSLHGSMFKPVDCRMSPNKAGGNFILTEGCIYE
jgi:hypothetical protein